MFHDIGMTRKRFDFDNGYLIQSPCKQCWQRYQFPSCSHQCPTLDLIQQHLALGIETSYRYPDVEPYTVLLDDGRSNPSY